MLIKNLYFCIHFFGIVGWKTKYSIEFKGLKEGLHDYEFEADRTFFEHFDEGLVETGEVQIKVQLEKRSSFLKLKLEFFGWVELICDRCLEPYQQDIELDTDIFVKFGEENEFDEGDNVIWVLPEEHVINLAQVIYEYIVLGIPLKHVHPNKTGENSCDPEMLKKLKTYLLHDTEEDERDEKEIDPRWAALKNLKNNN